MEHLPLRHPCFSIEATDDAHAHKTPLFCQEHGGAVRINSNPSAWRVNQIQASSCKGQLPFNVNPVLMRAATDVALSRTQTCRRFFKNAIDECGVPLKISLIAGQ